MLFFQQTVHKPKKKRIKMTERKNNLASNFSFKKKERPTISAAAKIISMVFSIPKEELLMERS